MLNLGRHAPQDGQVIALAAGVLTPVADPKQILLALARPSFNGDRLTSPLLGSFLLQLGNQAPGRQNLEDPGWEW